MDVVDTGQLTLETVPGGKSEEAIVAYLAKLYKSISRDKLVGLVKRAPVVLSRNVPATTARKIIAELEKLGATAVYVPNGSEKTRTTEEKTSGADLGMPILQAFQGDLPRVPVSFLYNLGLTLVAFAMLLLPLIYLGLITGVVYLLYCHATESIELLQRLTSARKLKAQPLFKLDLSHAKIQSRIEQARTRDTAKVFISSPPASILFKDFSARAHRVSLDYYRGVFGKEVMPRNLVSVAAMVKSHDEEWEYSRALNRFSRGQFTVLRPIGLPQNCLQATVDYNKIPPMLKSVREVIMSSAGDYDQRLKRFNSLEIRIMEDLRQILARLRRLLMDITYPFEHTQAQMTLGEFAIVNVPGKDELGPLLDGAYEAVDRLFKVYVRLVGRLAHLAELVENGLGLPPLPEPPQPHN